MADTMLYELFTVCAGELIQPGGLTPAARAAQDRAVDFIVSQPGFVGIYPTPMRGTLCLFKTEQQAQETRLSLIAAGHTCRGTVGRVYMEKAIVDEAVAFVRQVRGET